MSGSRARPDGPGDGRPGPLRLRVAQTAPRRADLAHNRGVVEAEARRAAEEGVDLLVLPELALTGYDVGHRARELALPFPSGGRHALDLPAGAPALLVGAIERAPDQRIHNVAVAARGDRVLHVHRKVHLPTYGSFDEGRLFAPGRAGPRPFDGPAGWRVAGLVCEELWHPAMPYLAALRGADLVVTLAAAVGRGAPGEGLGGDDVSPADGDGASFPSWEVWELLARHTAAVHGVWVVVANRAGVEGPLTFAGSSLVVGPDGAVVARASAEGPDRVDLTLDHDAVRRARRSFSHLRDEEPGLVARELEAILREER